jgi:hypothetical protein
MFFASLISHRSTQSWWLAIVVQLWLKLHSKQDRFITLTHIVGWGIPLFSLSVAYANRQITSDIGYPLCFTQTSKDGGFLPYVVVFGPTVLILASGIVVIGLICWKIASAGKKYKAKLSKAIFVRLGSYLLLALISLASLWSIKLYFDANRDRLEAEVADFIVCKAKGGMLALPFQFAQVQAIASTSTRSK